MKTKKIYIYCIYFLTSKKYYIGITDNIRGRMFSHFRSGSLVCEALWKYDDWTIEILHTSKDRDTANLLEIEEIRHYNSVAPNGYNLSRGGEGSSGYKHTEEAKEKMKGRKHSEEWKKENSERMQGNQHLLGKKLLSHSKWMKENNPTKRLEVRAKISKAGKGRKHSEETKKKCRNAKIGNKNPMKRKDVKIKQHIGVLKYRIAKLEAEI